MVGLGLSVGVRHRGWEEQMKPQKAVGEGLLYKEAQLRNMEEKAELSSLLPAENITLQ